MGASAHADDVRTVTSSLHCLEKQAGLVQTFAHQNGLSLNIRKCEVMIASSICKTEKVSVSIESMNIVAKKSLGFWWSWDLSAKVAIEEAIKKARRAFFMHSSQVFQGSLNPLSGRALFEVCVIPVLLYGCENWILMASLLTKLEHFQGEIGRRILHQATQLLHVELPFIGRLWLHVSWYPSCAIYCVLGHWQTLEMWQHLYFSPPPHQTCR